MQPPTSSYSFPGLLANSAALWVLCRFISKKNSHYFHDKTSLWLTLPTCCPYPSGFTITSPTIGFQRIPCLLCLPEVSQHVCQHLFPGHASAFRGAFLLKPFRARDWKRRYDVVPVLPYGSSWVLPVCHFIMRSTDLANNIDPYLLILVTRKWMQWLLKHDYSCWTGRDLWVPVVIIAWCTWKWLYPWDNHLWLSKESVKSKSTEDGLHVCCSLSSASLPIILTLFFIPW